MPTLLKLLARNLLTGIAAGWITLGMLLLINIGGLRDILFSSSSPVLALVLLAFGFTITFGSLAMGAAIMTMPYDGDQEKGGGLKIVNVLAHFKNRLLQSGDNRSLVPVPVKDKPQHYTNRP